MIDLPFRPDRSASEPVYRQLATQIRELIEAGRLAPHTKLPASRELARGVGIARVTAVQAYEQLARAGLVVSRVGQGTFVAAREDAAAAAPAKVARGFAWSSLFAERARALEVPPGLGITPPGTVVRHDFRGGQVDPGSLPLDEIRRAIVSALRRRGPRLAEHGDPFGWPALREQIARWLLTRGIRCEAADVLITSGAQQAIELACRVLVDPGDTVVVEQPGYFGATLALRAAQAHVVGVDVDAAGLRTDDLARVLQVRRVKLVCVTPAVQSPTGAAMSEPRRRALLALADVHQVPVLEDDYAAELRYDGAVVRALKAEDTAGQVVHVGTFSKVLFPNLRVGFVVAPRPLLGRMALARWSADGGGALLPQVALTTLLRSGALERHLRRLRKLYAERLRAMVAALRAHMPGGASWIEPCAGLSVWLTLPPPVDGEAVFRDALAAGIAYTRGDAFRVDGRGSGQAVLAFSKLAPREIEEGIARLAAIVRRHAARAAAPRARRRDSGGRDGATG